MTTRLRSGAGRRVNYRALAGLRPRRYRKRRAGVNTSKVIRALGFPDRMITKLEYRTSHTNTSTGGATDYVDYNLNSVYDPEVALGGHQPLWTDQYATLYNKYRVFRAKYELKIVAVNAGGVPARYVTLSSAQAPGALPATIQQAWEQNRTGNRLLPPGPDKITTIRGNIGLPKLQGQTVVEFKGDDGNDALLSANPLNPAILRVMMESTNTSSSEVQYQYDIRIVYFVEFFDRKTPATS